MISGQKIPLTAGAALTNKRLVKIGAADRTVIPAAAATDTPFGVAEFDAASGDTATIQVDGVAFVEAGAIVSRGDKITSDASGRGVTAAPAAGTNNGVIGIALQAAGAAGDWIEVLLIPSTLQG